MGAESAPVGDGRLAPRLVHANEQGYKCYACNIGIEKNFQNSYKRLTRFIRYEQMVEFIETLPVGAELSRVWLARVAFDGGPDNNNIAYLVVRDMAMHGILEPLNVRQNGKVHSYRKVL